VISLGLSCLIARQASSRGTMRGCHRLASYVRQMSMKRNIKKRMGRPVTVAGEKSVTIRLPARLLNDIDEWAAANDASKSEAIRRLLEQALKRK
jgi:ribbon-helix-helix CopG family protein